MSELNADKAACALQLMESGKQIGRQSASRETMDEGSGGGVAGGECTTTAWSLVSSSSAVVNSCLWQHQAPKSPRRRPAGVCGVRSVFSNLRRAPENAQASSLCPTEEAHCSDSPESFSRATAMEGDERQLRGEGMFHSLRTDVLHWKQGFCRAVQEGDGVLVSREARPSDCAEDAFPRWSRRAVSRRSLPESTGPPSSAATSDWTGTRRSSTKQQVARQEVLGKERKTSGFLSVLSRGRLKNDRIAGFKSRLLLRCSGVSGGRKRERATRDHEYRVRGGFTEEDFDLQKSFHCDVEKEEEEDGDVSMRIMTVGCPDAGHEETGRRKRLRRKGVETVRLRDNLEDKRSKSKNSNGCCACGAVHRKTDVLKRRKAVRPFSQMECQTGYTSSQQQQQRLAGQRSWSTTALPRSRGSLIAVMKGKKNSNQNRGRRWSFSDYRESGRGSRASSSLRDEFADLSDLPPLSASAAFRLCRASALHAHVSRLSEHSCEPFGEEEEEECLPGFGFASCCHRPPPHAAYRGTVL